MMLYRLRRTRRNWRTVGLLLVAALVAAQGLQAAAIRSCPHHGGTEHASAADSPAAHPGASTSEGAPPSHETEHVPAPHDESVPHDGPCDCLGPCGAGQAIDAPGPAPVSASAEVARTAIGSLPRRDAPPTLRGIPFVLPYPNPPPA